MRENINSVKTYFSTIRGVTKVVMSTRLFGEVQHLKYLRLFEDVIIVLSFCVRRPSLENVIWDHIALMKLKVVLQSSR